VKVNWGPVLGMVLYAASAAIVVLALLQFGSN
jgi:hypothetical protein